MGGVDDDPPETPMFKSKLGLVLSCLGCVIGTGNIWRFPRIVAQNSGEEGGLAFLLVWALGLWVWSIPVILIEYAVGRYSRKTVVGAFEHFHGPWYVWMGGWMAIATLGVAGYYAVIVGWCFYYTAFSCFNSLPTTLNESRTEWDYLQDSNWPIVCHAIGCVLAGISIIKGVKTIETINKIIVPLLLVIVLFSTAWALSLQYAYEGITYLFSPDWSVLKTPQAWIDAVTQNAWDTGAGDGLFLTYATYMRRHDGIVSMGTVTPIANNFVSLCCGIMTFCNVFSVLSLTGYTRREIVPILKDSGPAATGLTFIWMPLLYAEMTAGRFLAVLFFLSLAFAGFSSLIATFELLALVLENMGVSRIVSAIVVTIVTFGIGAPSALDVNYLVGQDEVWSFALIPSGLMLVGLVVKFGADRFRAVCVNEFGTDDWKLRKAWNFAIMIVTPLVGLTVLIWWIVDTSKMYLTGTRSKWTAS
ncbi:uncharacterized sodium-dependent transporter HI_0736-like [Oscarella lobularis]|uniref:uncharacterized sodium-dependent transporter HI_0736-like n=1 Tax=Oscarella lobularis TaxID=121494 RepID=UPI0033136B67